MMCNMKSITALLMAAAGVHGHGALTTPPSRAALCGWGNCETEWNAANKGAQTGMWTSETPICGGTDLLQPQDIQASYTAGQVVSLGVSTTARHMGYYEFRLCVPPMGQQAPSTNNELMDCVLSGPLLKRAQPLQPGQQSTYKGNTPAWTQTQLETRWRQEPEDGTPNGNFLGGQTYSLDYIIPDVECDHCVLHFYWQSLNSWQGDSADSIGTTSGERFWNCADIAITGGNGGNGPISNPTPAPTLPIPTNEPTHIESTSACVSHEELMAINNESSWWPKCDPYQSKNNAGPAGYDFGYYCDSVWVAELNKVLSQLGYCDDKETIRKFLAQIAYETGYYSTLGQPIDDGSGMIHMIPANWEINANDMEAVFPGHGLLQAFFDYPVTKNFFKQPQYAWKSAAAWFKRTNRVIPGCGKDLFTESYDEQTRCILGRVVDRSEVLDLVSRHINGGGSNVTPSPTAAAATPSPTTGPAPTPNPTNASTTPSPTNDGGDDQCTDTYEACQANWCGDAYWASQCKSTCNACSPPPSACNDIFDACQANWCSDDYWNSQCKSTCNSC